MNISNNHTYSDLKTFREDIFKIANESPDVGKDETGGWILWINGLRFIAEKPVFGYGLDNIARD